MKAKNFPGRRQSRAERARARELGLPQPLRTPDVADTRFRLGRATRAQALPDRFTGPGGDA